jgi:putative cardiolipin synthase
MHNKIYEVDGVVAIVGGRNIGDNYFNFERDQPNFRDLDLLVVGPASTDVGRAFDLYWNSPWAYPAQALVARPPTAAEAQRTFAALEAYAAQNEQYQRAYPGAKRDYLESLLHAHENLTWAKVEVVVDRPAKVAAGGTPHSQVAERLATEWRQARREVLAESAYFVPGPSALGEITAARRRGVRVAVLTNSLSSTDVAAVHAGYMKRRPTLLRLGVELHEFKRTPTERPPRRGVRNRNELFDGQSSLASLHAKALVFDREVGWVGSFNLDPRSRSINTEVGLLVHDAAFAERLARTIEANFAPSISWRVELDDRGRLVWRGERNGRPVEEHGEPDTTWGARALARALALLPGMDRML